ncbi:MAG TPA: co-chaperone DjlA [Oligoflexia bacterium]|nr:co-chaperone DjlA [Oligoflexia bacterium]
MIFVFKLLFAYFGFQAAAWFGVNQLVGLLVGLFVGHVVDYAATMRFARWRARRFYLAEARKNFDNTYLTSLFHMFGQICGADGVISKEEIGAVERVMTEMLQLKRKARLQAITSFKKARTSAVPFQTSAVKYFELYQAHPEMLESTVQMFLNVACADGPLNEAEEQFINTAASIFGIAPGRYQQMKTPYSRSSGSSANGSAHSSAGTNGVPRPGSLTEAYALLGCDKNAAVSDIKKNYRKLVMEYHPDTIVSKGLPEDFIKFANHKFASIQAAYEQVRSDRGF